MPNGSDSGTSGLAKLKIFVRVTTIGFAFTWFGFLGVAVQFNATRPVSPDPEEGRVIPLDNRGHIVYLTKQEQARLHTLQGISIVLGIVSCVASYFYRKETGKFF